MLRDVHAVVLVVVLQKRRRETPRCVGLAKATGKEKRLASGLARRRRLLQLHNSVFKDDLVTEREKTVLFVSFPYDCPEPVLAK